MLESQRKHIVKLEEDIVTLKEENVTLKEDIRLLKAALGNFDV